MTGHGLKATGPIGGDTGHMTSTSGTPAIAVHGGAFDIAPRPHGLPSRGLPRGRACGLAGARGRRQRPGRRRTSGPGARGVGHLRRRARLGPERRGLHRARRRDDGRGRGCRSGRSSSVRGVPHAITLARRVLESPFAVFAGAGAHQFAERTGVETCDPDDLVSDHERALWEDRRAHPDPNWVETMFGHDTVGAIVLDRAGDLAAGTSTGGMPYKPAGRVGDSPFIGAGLYADNLTGAGLDERSRRTDHPASSCPRLPRT